MRPDTSRWRVESAYELIDHAGVDQLAWECLRRNHAYQDDYADLRRTDRLDDPLPEAMEARWGLRFRGPATALRH